MLDYDKYKTAFVSNEDWDKFRSGELTSLTLYANQAEGLVEVSVIGEKEPPRCEECGALETWSTRHTNECSIIPF